jgi:molybdopterin-binding protein
MPPERLSARNRLAVRVLEAHEAGNTAIIVLDAGLPQPLLARLTPGAMRELNLKPGGAAWALIKPR